MAIETNTDIENSVGIPKQYRVYMINDDYTSWDFCIRIIVKVFHRSVKEADAITNQIHTKGKGLCGVYSFEIAETKADQVEVAARNEGFPMKCSIEEDN